MKRFMHLGHLLQIFVSNFVKSLDVDSWVASQLPSEQRQERHRRSSDQALVRIRIGPGFHVMLTSVRRRPPLPGPGRECLQADSRYCLDPPAPVQRPGSSGSRAQLSYRRISAGTLVSGYISFREARP